MSELWLDRYERKPFKKDIEKSNYHNMKQYDILRTCMFWKYEHEHVEHQQWFNISTYQDIDNLSNSAKFGNTSANICRYSSNFDYCWQFLTTNIYEPFGDNFEFGAAHTFQIPKRKSAQIFQM